MRRLSLLLCAVALAAACGRRDTAADSTAAQHDSTGVANATGAGGANTLTTSSAVGEPPPPPIDTNATMFLTGATAAAPVEDSANVRFHYDSTSAGYVATFSAADSTTVAPNTTLTGAVGGGTISGTGRITAKSPGGTIVVDLTKGIAGGSTLGKCPANPASGQGRCGTVTFDSAQFTPRNGGTTVRRSVRLLLGR
jgi:hypothetical protein